MKNRLGNERRDIDRIVKGRHPCPHAYLGNHRVGDNGGAGIAVRAFLPGCDNAGLVVDGADAPARPMTRIHEDGLYEIVISDQSDFFPYTIEVVRDQQVERREDPYRFLPTIHDFYLDGLRGAAYHQAYRTLGAHHKRYADSDGYAFAVWAPNARQVSVVGDFNRWDHRVHPMRYLGGSGIWEIFIPGIGPGALYKYSVLGFDGRRVEKTDPYAFAKELRPKTASLIWDIDAYTWHDQEWMQKRAGSHPFSEPMSIYEVHLGSWARVPEDGNRWLNYRELAVRLAAYVRDMGFTHVELLPLAEHPLDESWGYQVSGFFAPTSRFGTPDDFKFFVDYLHRNGVGVIIDWVPSHFPKDDFSLARFDGTCLYEHADSRQGEHKEWGTLVFNYGRHEVRSYLMSNALFWLEQYHVDGIRVDAVASMLYLDYSRKEGEWIPNRYGGRENLEAIEFLKELNVVTHAQYPGAIMIAEESTAWFGVSRPTYLGGLGFDFKWNMGWMHDMLEFFSSDPIYRKYKHDLLTFALLYAFNENFVLSLSHDEVVHGKRSLLNRMPGDEWQQFANLRALYGYMFAQPGKKLLFMGGEFGQWKEWDHAQSLDWHLVEREGFNRGLQRYVRDLQKTYRAEAALFEIDHHHEGFQWIDFHDWEKSVVSFVRYGRDRRSHVLCIFNFTPVPRFGYRIGVPADAYYREIINSDSLYYGGSNLGNGGGVRAEGIPFSVFAHSIAVTLPPLSAVYFKPVEG